MRLFVGVPVPCGDVLGPVRNTLQRLDGVRPVPEGTEHVTLRFLGDVDDPSEVTAIQNAVGAAVASSPSMSATVPRLGVFKDPRHARVVWAGLEAEGLARLQELVVEATARMGQPEVSRQFVAHITLARCKQPQDLRMLLERFPGPLWSGRLDEVVLFASATTPEGPVYERLQVWSLAAPGAGVTAPL